MKPILRPPRRLARGLLLALLLCGTSAVHAQPDAAGELALVGFNADGDDGLAFVLLVDTPDGTVVWFTDEEWTGTAFAVAAGSGEGDFTWTNDTGSTLAAGTVVVVTDLLGMPGVTHGSLAAGSNGMPDLNASDEQVYAFIGSERNPTTFLWCLANDDFVANSASLAGTGLVSGATALRLDLVDAEADVAVYDGATTCNVSVAACAAAIATASNWDTQDGSGRQDNDGTAPDFPDDVPAAFSGSALPVELTHFSALADGDAVTLRWETAGETNNAGFEVQHDAGSGWRAVGWVAGHGTTLQPQAYSFRTTPGAPGRQRYRLRQVDYDGAHAFSPVVTVTLAASAGGFVSAPYPNPFNPTARFEVLVETPQHVTVALYDLLGRQRQLLHRGPLAAGQRHPFVVAAGALPGGVYVVRVTGRTIRAAHPVVLLR